MRVIIVIILFCFSFSNALSQELALVKEIQRLTLANDSLQKQVIKPMIENLDALKNENDVKIGKLKDQIKTLEKDLKNIDDASVGYKIQINKLENQINNLKKDKSVIEKDRLNSKLDSLSLEISKFQTKIDSTQKLILVEKQTNSKQIEILRESNYNILMIEKEKSKNEIINLLIESYNNSFDELIKNNSYFSIKRDLRIIGVSTSIQNKLDQLLIYFESETILKSKYNSEKAAEAKAKLSKIEQSQLVIDLSDKIEKYRLKNEGLIKSLDKIILADSRNKVSEPEEHESKLKDILTEIASFYRNYKFKFLDYPYLTEIVLEVQKLKQKDSNADIKALREML